MTFREVDWEFRVRVVLFEVMFMRKGKRGVFMIWEILFIGVISMDDKYRLMGIDLEIER